MTSKPQENQSTSSTTKNFIMTLEKDLDAKLEECAKEKEALLKLADERDFYFQKLLKIEDLCTKFDESSSYLIMKYLKATFTEFNPRNDH